MKSAFSPVPASIRVIHSMYLFKKLFYHDIMIMAVIQFSCLIWSHCFVWGRDPEHSMKNPAGAITHTHTHTHTHSLSLSLLQTHLCSYNTLLTQFSKKKSTFRSWGVMSEKWKPGHPGLKLTHTVHTASYAYCLMAKNCISIALNPYLRLLVSDAEQTPWSAGVELQGKTAALADLLFPVRPLWASFMCLPSMNLYKLQT